jgi:hypothetical protein
MSEDISTFGGSGLGRRNSARSVRSAAESGICAIGEPVPDVTWNAEGVADVDLSEGGKWNGGKIHQIRIDRLEAKRDYPIDEVKVLRYMELQRNGVKYPPISVRKDGDKYVLVNGFHRLEAHKRADKTHINCTFVE